MKAIIYSICAVSALLTAGCVQTKTDLSAFTETVYQPTEASGFTITAIPGSESTLLTVTDPWQGADSITASLFISRGGESAPEGFNGQVIDGDAARVVAMSSTYVAMLDAIGEGNRVAGVSGIRFLSSPSVAARRDSIADVGYEANVDYETLIATDPDIVLLYGVNGASVMEPKLRELGIPYIYIGDYLEQSPVGKAEWMVAVGEIIGQRAKAVDRFNEIRDAYDSLSQAVDHTTQPVKVMINAPYGDSWFIPAASSYMSRLIEDAGGQLVYRVDEGNSSISIDTEQAYLFADEAEVWINPGMASSMADLRQMTPRFMDVRPVKSSRVFNNNALTTADGGNDFYESGTVRPDLILRDLINIIGDSAPTVPMTYYRRLD